MKLLCLRFPSLTWDPPVIFHHSMTCSPIFENCLLVHSRPLTSKVFLAVGTFTIVIEILNGITASKLTLTEVLYSPKISYTLVSIRKLDALGLHIVFEDGQCTIYLLDEAV